MDKNKTGHGGHREGAGRKKTTAKTYGFNAPEDIVAILENIEGSKTEYILNAIRHYHTTQTDNAR